MVDEIDILCGMYIKSGSVNLTRVQAKRVPVGSTFSMPWLLPDNEVANLGGPTYTLFEFVFVPLLPPGRAEPVFIHYYFQTEDDGQMALAEIEAEIAALTANLRVMVNLVGLEFRTVEVLPLDEVDPFEHQDLVIELFRQNPEQATLLPFERIGAGLAKFAGDERQAARVIMPMLNLLTPNNAPWIRISTVEIAKFQAINQIRPPGLESASYADYLPIMLGWQANSTFAVPGGEDDIFGDYLGLGQMEELLTAAELDLNENDIPTGFVYVYDLTYRFRDGFLQIEGDLSGTTPLAPNFRWLPLGSFIAQLTLEPKSLKTLPFSNFILENLFEAVIDVTYDFLPGTDVDELAGGDNWEGALEDALKNRLEDTIGQQVSDTVAPRIRDELATRLNERRPAGLFTDANWNRMIEHIDARFFLHFTQAQFFGERDINGVPVLGGVEFSGLTGVWSDELRLLSAGQDCPAAAAAGATGRTFSYNLAAEYKKTVKADKRFTGWLKIYEAHRSELAHLLKKDKMLALKATTLGFRARRMLFDPAHQLEKDLAEEMVSTLQPVIQNASAGLAQTLADICRLIGEGAGLTLSELADLAHKNTPDPLPDVRKTKYVS